MGPDCVQPGSDEPDWLRPPDAMAAAAWRRKGWLLAGLVLGLGAAAAVSKLLPPAYQSSAQISILRKSPEAVPDPHLSALEALAPPTEVLRSPAIVADAVKARNLGQLASFAYGDGDVVTRVRAALTAVPAKVPAGQGNLFRLACQGPNGDDCRTVLAAVLDSYRASLERQHQDATGNAIEFLLREQEKVRKELAKQEADYLTFREAAPLLGKARDGLDLRQERLNGLQTKRSALLLQKLEVEGQLATLERVLKEGHSPDAVLVLLAEFSRRGEAGEPGARAAADPHEQLLPLLLEERKLLQLHGPSHPEVQAVRGRIDAARRLLLLPPAAWKAEADGSPPEDPVQVHVAVFRQKLEHLKTAEAILTAAFQKEQDEARRLAASEIRNETFQSNIAQGRQLTEALVKRLNDSSLIKGAGGYRVEVIEPPSAPRRVSPNFLLNLTVGGFLGILAGLLVAVGVPGRPGRRPHVRSPRTTDGAVSDPEQLAVSNGDRPPAVRASLP
jgi:uncharacterized protein involved in exopolysaccharide biosynthesis